MFEITRNKLTIQMKRIARLGAIRRFVRQEDGAAAVEFGLLLAQGLVLGLALVALFFTGRILCHLANPLPERIGPPAPGYLHLPPQAPPVGLS